MKQYKRVFLIVVDSLGIGAMDDASLYGDEGSNTFKHIYEAGQWHLPNLKRLGLHHLCGLSKEKTIGYHMRLKETSVGKDTMTGHFEMMGLHVKEPFLTFTKHGFPDDLIHELETKCQRKVIGNKAASGTEILKELANQEKDGKLIVYTSADSVLQICGNEEEMGLDTLYQYCEIARTLTMKKEWQIGRVIARPYIIKDGKYVRTSHRKDYALKPPGKTVLNALIEKGYDVIGIGKIHDIFDGEGISESLHSNSSVHGMKQTLEVMERDFEGLCFVNLVDFDALWGHRRDALGYGQELERFDVLLGQVLDHLRDDDLLCISADHGNDPTHIGSDHTREMVPLLVYSTKMKQSTRLDDNDTFACIGASIADNFEIRMPEGTIGTSILEKWK